MEKGVKREAAERDEGRGGLYVHVPFCVRKCPYCAFWSEGGRGREARRAWMEGIRREWARRVRTEEGLQGWRPATVFFGGGTPTALEAGELEELLGWVRSAVDVSGVREWSVEANPGTLTEEKAWGLARGGVTRVSVGVQSLDAGTLRRLGRIHGPAEARAAVEMARGAGIRHVGADWMYGVPGTEEAVARRDIEAVAGLAGVDHVSCYALEVEPGTAFARRRLRPDEGEQARLYEVARQVLRERGFGQYELSNWARAGGECRHNLLYWSGGEYVGLGPGAHSHWRGERSGNSRGIGRWRRAFRERLEGERKACETLVFGLRRIAGWGREEFREASGGYEWGQLRGREIRRLAGEGLLEESADRLRLTERALFVSDVVFRELV